MAALAEMLLQAPVEASQQRRDDTAPTLGSIALHAVAHDIDGLPVVPASSDPERMHNREDIARQIAQGFSDIAHASLDVYMREIGRIPLLGREQENELAALIAVGDVTAIAALGEANLRLVLSIAARYKDHGLTLADLLEAGNAGLMRAVLKFNPERGKFSTCAYWWIRSGISYAFKRQHQRDQRLLRTGQPRVVETEDGDMLSPMDLSLDTGPAPEEIAERHERHALLEQAFTHARLTSRELEAMRWLNGLMDGRDNHTLRSVAAEMRITYGRVEQLKRAALAKLEHYLRGMGFDAEDI